MKQLAEAIIYAAVCLGFFYSCTSCNRMGKKMECVRDYKDFKACGDLLQGTP